MKLSVLSTIALLSITWTSCTNENAPDCLKATGDIATKELSVSEPFERILVKDNIELEIEMADTVAISVESGSTLINEIKAEVVGDRLVLTNENSCNNLRAYNTTKILVRTPVLTQIRSSTQFPVRSRGVLNFENLTLISEDFNEPSEVTNGEFILDLDVEELSVVSNNLSFFLLQGKVNTLNITFASGIGRFDGRDLVTQKARITHRGTNKIIVNPRQILTGEIRSTGDIVAVHTPDSINVQEFYKGRLILE